MIIFKQFTFDAAHFLPNVPETHKCREIHGHTYKLIVFIEGPVDAHTGWVIDFANLKADVNSILDKVDHKFLNKIEGLENPTCELMAVWLWNQIKPLISELKKIELYETPTSGVIYEGN
jgi:6-pyruvoyltetrahydropterin/6-carboxytetrahydropterin synthase